MRDNEFRAWDKDRKQMHKSSKMVEWVFKNGVLSARNLSRKRKIQELEVMQYIGIEDKNGVKIFEGDILEYSASVWKSSRFRVEWSDRHGGWSGNGLFSEWSEHCVVIGNIYESPELIEVES